MPHTRKRGSIAKVTYFPEGCIDMELSSINNVSLIKFYFLGRL